MAVLDQQPPAKSVLFIYRSRSCHCKHVVWAKVIVLDELGDRQDVELAKRMSQRGIAGIATVHSTDFSTLVQDPEFKMLLGGVEDVIIGDRAAAAACTWCVERPCHSTTVAESSTKLTSAEHSAIPLVQKTRLSELMFHGIPCPCLLPCSSICLVVRCRSTYCIITPVQLDVKGKRKMLGIDATRVSARLSSIMMPLPVGPCCISPPLYMCIEAIDHC